MKTFTYILAGILCSLGELWAQQPPPATITMKGRLIDKETKEGLPYTTIFLKSDPGMETIKGCVSDENGFFLLKAPKVPMYWLTVSYVGYMDMMFGVAGDKDFGEIGMIVSQNMLGVVNVKPLVEQTVDKITYNITSDPDRDKLPVSEILKKMPMIRQHPNGNIYVDSPDKKFLVVRDGKVDALFSGNIQNMLKDLPAKGFTTVRLLLAPPERYGEYDYILDIVSDKSTRLIGAVGSLRGGYQTQENSVQLYPEATFSSGKLRGVISASGMTSDPVKQHSRMEQTYVDNSQQRTQWGVVSQSSRTGGLKGMFSYDVLKNHFLSFLVDYNDGLSETHRTQTSETRIGDEIVRYYTTRTQERRSTPKLTTSFDYQIDFTKPDRILNFSWLYSGRPTTTRHELVTEEREAAQQQRKDKSKNEAFEHVVQLNYTDQLSVRWNMETGLKYAIRNYLSRDEYAQLEQETWQPEEERYSLLDRKYNIATVYAKMSYTQKKLRVSASAQGEYLDDGRGTLMVNGDKSGTIQEDGFVFYPKVDVYYKFPKVRIEFNYILKMSRPGLLFLNTTVPDPNADVITVGNPNLDPERKHQYRLVSYFGTGKISYDALVLFSHSNNSISSYWYKNEEGKTIRSYRNYGSSRSLYGKYGILYYSSPVHIMGMLRAGYSYEKIGKNDEQYSYNFSLSANIGYSWKNGWTLTVIPDYSYWYTDGQEGSYRQPFSVGVSTSKKFLKGRLELGAGISNILRIREKNTTEVSTPNFSMKTETIRNGCSANLSVNYRFGSFQVKPVRQAKSKAAITDVKTDEL